MPNLEPGYPGGIFDPLGFSKGNLKELQTKELKNGRLAMIAFMGFVLQVRRREGGGGRTPGRVPAALGLGSSSARARTTDACPPPPSLASPPPLASQAQATGKGPLEALGDHLGNPAGANWTTNIGTCAVPKTVDIQGLSIPLTCLWPGQQ